MSRGGGRGGRGTPESLAPCVPWPEAGTEVVIVRGQHKHGAGHHTPREKGAKLQPHLSSSHWENRREEA